MRSRARTEAGTKIKIHLTSPNIRTGLGADAIVEALVDNLRYLQAKLPQHATRHDWYMALAYTIRDRLLDRCHTTTEMIGEARTKVVAYLSAEFLPGPHLGNSLMCLGIRPATEQALTAVGQDLETILDQEEEPGLGNGGLGRLAACYMDSLATLEVPAIGYGIRYEFGVFDQAIRDGWQVELTDKWLRFGNPWEIVRSDVAYDVGFGGRTERYLDDHGDIRVRWRPRQMVKGVAYDTPVPGYRVPTANLLRLWKAEAVESFDFEAFNVGDYYRAVEQKVASETISKVLYPSDEPAVGARLRLAQQYFFVSCSLQDMVRLHLMRGKDVVTFDSYWAAQLNDTYPSIAIAELMRILVDEHGMAWDFAWDITQQTCAYTNHTLMAEALEKWPVSLIGSLLPRHLEIIYEINRRFLDGVRTRCPDDEELVQRLSLIDETGDRSVRMAHLASVGSHAINGVAPLHTRRLTETVLRDFHLVAPEKFRNVTNGVTPRRWLLLSNPALAALVSRYIDDDWILDLGALERLEALAVDTNFQREWRAIRADNKRALAAYIASRTGIVVDPRSLFDIHVKRIHEYKRQLLNVLRIVSVYNRIKRGDVPATPRTVIFGGKAAPGCRMAKLIIKLINAVADVVNRDAAAASTLRVVFIPDFNVKNAQRIYPAADVSEHIALPGREASGTGNMKFALNGALTVGTFDGSNIELRNAVGVENFFLFGATADEVRLLGQHGYAPRDVYVIDPELRAAIDAIAMGMFSNGDRTLFQPLVDRLLTRDEYMVLLDYRAYLQCQQAVDDVYRDQRRWTRMSILNTARVGRFSSDRSIREYCRDIWNLTAAPAHA
jgi:starch phosphorylase